MPEDRRGMGMDLSPYSDCDSAPGAPYINENVVARFDVLVVHVA
jgi:hypothetical protein